MVSAEWRTQSWLTGLPHPPHLQPLLRCSAGLQSCPLDLQNQRVDVPRLQRRIEQTPVEVAVVADGRTERDVDVETEHCDSDWRLMIDGDWHRQFIKSINHQSPIRNHRFYDPARPPDHLRSPLPSRSWARAWRPPRPRAMGAGLSCAFSTRSEVVDAAVGRQLAVVGAVHHDELAHLVKTRAHPVSRCGTSASSGRCRRECPRSST